MKNGNPAGEPGRPPCDVMDEIYAVISSQMASGQSLTDAAKKGVVILDHARKPLRQLKGKHLQSSFRDAERERIVPWLRLTVGYQHGWPTFMGRPLTLPFGAAVPSQRRRGRPKKIRPQSK